MTELVTVKISDDVRDVLKRSSTIGDLLILPQGLPRTEYVAVDKVLKVLGGKWNRKREGHVFPTMARAIIDHALKNEVIDKKKSFQLFETPDHIADMVVEKAIARLLDDEGPFPTFDRPLRVLEPSAGTGQLACAFLRGMAKESAKYPEITCVELQTELIYEINERLKAFEGVKSYVINRDFLDTNRLPSEDVYKEGVTMCSKSGVRPVFDAVVMNPPFSKFQYIAHIRHAVQFVVKGGICVSVVPRGWERIMNKRTGEFVNFLKNYSVEYDQLPDDAFKKSGTAVKTELMIIHV